MHRRDGTTTSLLLHALRDSRASNIRECIWKLPPTKCFVNNLLQRYVTWSHYIMWSHHYVRKEMMNQLASVLRKRWRDFLMPSKMNYQHTWRITVVHGGKICGTPWVIIITCQSALSALASLFLRSWWWFCRMPWLAQQKSMWQVFLVLKPILCCCGPFYKHTIAVDNNCLKWAHYVRDRLLNHLLVMWVNKILFKKERTVSWGNANVELMWWDSFFSMIFKN